MQTAQDKLAWLDGQIQGREFVCGDRLTLADILLFCFLDFGATVGQTVKPELTAVTALVERMKARPSAAPEGTAKWGGTLPRPLIFLWLDPPRGGCRPTIIEVGLDACVQRGNAFPPGRTWSDRLAGAQRGDLGGR